MNVILINIDSLRSDHLGINGYRRNTSPNMDKLAEKGMFFPNTISVMAVTSPSIASVLTGLYPHSHGIRFNYTHKLNPNITTLQEILQVHGYKTIGNDIEMNGIGIERGFDAFNLLHWRVINKIKRTFKKTFNWDYKVDPAETLTDFAIKYIKKFKNKKFFLYLHYVALHWPYNPPKPYDEIFDHHYKGAHTFNEVSDRVKRGDLIFDNKLPREEIEHAISHYDGSVRFVDFQIGRLLKCINDYSLTDNTLVVLFGDHGECFGEHNTYFNHGEYLYDESLKVPLIMHNPKLPIRRVESQVQVIDIMPTVLEILGINLLENIDGRSLMPVVNYGKKVREYAFAESGMSFFKQNKRIYIKGEKGKWRMIRTDEWKLIYIPHPKEDIYELYNLKDDPKETKNLVNKEPEIADKLKGELFKWMGTPEEEKIELTEKSKRLLKKLGYMD